MARPLQPHVHTQERSMLTLWLAYKAWKERCASEPYVTGYDAE